MTSRSGGRDSRCLTISAAGLAAWMPRMIGSGAIRIAPGIRFPPAGFLPLRPPVALFEGTKAGTLGIMEALHQSRIFMPIPSPGGTLDAGRRQNPRVGRQPLEAFLMGSVSVSFGVHCHP